MLALAVAVRNLRITASFERRHPDGITPPTRKRRRALAS
jgi:hypothetical protein